LQRRQLRAALVVAVMASLGALGFVLGRTLIQREAAERALPAQDLLPDVSQRIRDFRRVKVSDGHTVWELKASEAQYFEEQKEILVTEPEVAFYGDGDPVRMVGREGHVRLDGRELDWLKVEGGVQVEAGGYRLVTDQAVYDRGRNAIIAPKGIHVSGSDVDLTGDALVVDLTSQRVHVVGNVTSKFARAPADGTASPEKVSLADRIPGGRDVVSP